MRTAAFLCLAAILANAVGAARPRTWQQQTYADFADGKTQGTSIDAGGSLRLAPALDSVAAFAAERVWSLAAGPNGALYVGTGDGGKLFAVDARGQTQLLFDSPEIGLHALVWGPDGHLYAGTSPDGLIYRIAPNGQATTLAHTGSHYVWDLAFDEKVRLHAATGEPAKVLSISAKGEIEELFAPADRHVMALLFSGGRLYMGTARPGRIYEMAEGAGRLLYEAAQDEIHDLVATPDGHLYASALPASEPSEPNKPKPPSALYRVDPRGAVYALWEDSATTLADLVADPGGGLLIAASEPARLLHLESDGRLSLRVQLEDFRPSRLLRALDGSLYLGAAQAALVRRLGSADRQQGQFESRVEDFGVQARWGVLEWRADLPEGSRLSVQTRSGNSAEPDPTWSPWSLELTQSGLPIASPPARFIQYRVALETGRQGRTPVLYQVSLAGQPANLRPQIAELHTSPYRPQQPGANGSQSQGGPPPVQPGRPGRPAQAKSLRLVRWQVTDPNGDELAYSLYLRSVEQKEWKLVQENVSQNSLLWDTESMPEGWTLLKLVASDHLDNPREEALEAVQISAPFAIDNSPPRLQLKLAQHNGVLTVEVDIADRISPVQKAQYTIDYGETPYLFAPLDGVFDSRQEKARFSVTGLVQGEHVIGVQAWDALDNVGVEQVVVTIP